MQAPALSIRNGRRAVVITGTPEQLSRFELYCEKITEKEEAERKNKLRGGAVFRPVFNPAPGGGRFPHPAPGRRRHSGRRVGSKGRCRRRARAVDGGEDLHRPCRLGRAGRGTARRRRPLDHRPGPERHRDAPDRAGDSRPGNRHRRRRHPGRPAQLVHRRRGARDPAAVLRATRRRWWSCPTSRSSCRPSSPG